MALFQFTAVRNGTDTFSGQREAADKAALIAVLKGEGVVVLTAEPAARASRLRGTSLRVLLSANIISRVPSSEKILFARNLASMIAAGLPVSRALEVLRKQTRNVSMRETVRKVGEELGQGHALHDALGHYPKVFSALFCAMVRAGEESGTLSQSLQIVATQMEKSYALTKKVRGAMIYPAIVIIIILIIGVMMLIYVVPTLASTFASLNTALPLPTQIVLWLSDALTHNLLLFLVVVAALVGLFAWFRRTPVGKRLIDRSFLLLPAIGPIIARVNSARTARTLSSLLSSGIPALSALEITGDVVQNSRFRPVIADARTRVEKGKPLSEAFVQAEHIYPVMFSEMAAVGEETGDLAGMLSRVADFYESEVEEETKDLSTIIEPVLMVIIGAGVGFFAIAMIMPIYSLSSAI